MIIQDFKYGWRFTDEKYALFSDSELSNISILSAEKAVGMWDSICDNTVLQKCSFINKIISKTLPVLIGDCGWGDEEEEKFTRGKFESLTAGGKSGTIIVMYDRETSISVTCELFVEKWSDFCYPSDALILKSVQDCLLYYEDTIYSLS